MEEYFKIIKGNIVQVVSNNGERYIGQIGEVLSHKFVEILPCSKEKVVENLEKDLKENLSLDPVWTIVNKHMDDIRTVIILNKNGEK